MRILALSDIHGNITAVRQLRAREGNTFDAVVVAGDIGNDAAGNDAAAILEILSSFCCPILYVYGNWDGDLEYDRSFGPTCEHIHLKLVTCGPFSFVGFSGVPENWGRNPIAELLQRELNEKYQSILKTYAECQAEVEAEELEINSNYNSRLADLASRTRDRRRAHYRKKVGGLVAEREMQIRNAWRRLDLVAESKDYVAYDEELSQRWTEIGALNRRALAETIKRSKMDPGRTIVVTHSRIYRTSDDLPGVPLFLFGHKHGFKDTPFKGARFVNVSVLDQPVTVRPAKKRRASEDDWRNINAGNYAIIEARGPKDFDVKCVAFEPNFDGWKPIGDFVVAGLPWVEEICLAER